MWNHSVMSNKVDVVVVGTGPNGLAAAVLFAASGLSVTVLEAQTQPGGGVRTEELDLGVPLRHDLCSAVHPMAAASPFFRAFGLTERGVEFGYPDVSFAHPLDNMAAGIAYRSLDRTIDELGGTGSADGRMWRRVMAPLVAAVNTVRDIGLSDMRRLPVSALTPKGFLAAASMVGRALELGTPVWSHVTDAHRCGAMLTGVGAHANTALPSLAGAGTALLLGALAHAPGWPLPIGGSQVITDTLLADLRRRGATIGCDRPIGTAAMLPPARVYVFDTSAWTLAEVFGDRLAPRYRRALQRFRPGNGVAKVDFALSGPVPWSDPRIAAAGTVHLCGDRAQMKRSEADTSAGRHSDRPMTLLSQPAVVDPTRIGAGGARPLWTYAHVPTDSTRDMTPIVTSHIERYAPGFRDLIVGSRCIPAHDMPRHNANYRGGDIAVGHVSLYRMAARPVAKWDPYRTSLPNVYLCSGATPPGPGVHGMSGVHAATRVLRQHFDIRSMPDIGP